LKKKVLLALAGVSVTLGVAGFAVYSQGLTDISQPELNASLSNGSPLTEEEGEEESGDTPPVASSYDLSAHQTLSRVILLIRENYVEPDRIKPYDMFLAALDYIQKTVPEVMVDDSEAPARITVSVGNNQQVFDLGGLDQLWEVTMALRDIFRFLQTRISDPTQRRDIEYAAINGMLSTLDPHSVLLKPESFDEVKLSTKGEFGGLGIVISIRDGALTVISPIEGTPASKAGLKAKDKIVKIGEESTINMALDEAVQRLRGKPGSKVAIGVQRKGWTEARKFILTRAVIKIESVTSELLADSIGYVKIKSFQGNTFDDLQSHLDKLKQKNGNAEIKGLVMDLRNNPGGLLDQAILVSDRFIERGPLVITVGEGNRKREVKSAHFSGTENSYPIAVLLNGGSASASEIVSGALKNHDRAFVIGQQSFGKGSVQVLYDFKDRSALKLTIAQYLTPGDISIQSVGIAPDVAIVPAVIEKDSLHLFVDDEAPREKDLEKHLDQHGAGAFGTTAIKIIHLMPKEKEGGTPGEEEETTQDNFDYDFETHLAHDVLLKATTTNRQAIIKEAMPLFKARAAEQDEIVAKRLGELGVDWAQGQNAGAPHAEVELKTSAGLVPVAAGSMLTLTGTVRNMGDAPLYRVYGVTNSDNPLLKNLEFAFGKVMPGQSRSWDVKIKLPADMSARADGVSLVLGDASEGAHAKETSGQTFVSIEEQKKPRFAYSFRLDDSKGNGDGVLQLNEPVDLKVEVRNLGPGPAEEVTVTLKNLSGKPVFLDQGRNKLGNLAVNEAKTADLKFSVRAPADEVQLRLTVWDGSLGSPIAETLKLPVMDARKGKAEEHALKVEKEGEVPVYAGAADKMPIIGFAKSGTILKSDVSYGTWWKVDALPGTPGYVKQGDVEVNKTKKYTKGGVRPQLAATAPEIALELPSLVVAGDVLKLRGSITDDRKLKDVFVFVNDKKVYYRSLEDVKKTDKGVQASLDVPLTLKRGANTVAVVAREDDDMVGRKVFGVFRNDPNKQMAGAETDAAKDPKTKSPESSSQKRVE
jgi:carboxyl-terminal processing protease